MENIKLVLEYDGTNFVGWQVQLNGPSIQEELEKALGQILQEPVTSVAAGRTDAGVHARGQVASFRTSKEVDPVLLGRGLNGLLPADIVVLSCEKAEESFHARLSAKARVYRYFLNRRPTAIRRNHSWYVGGYRIDQRLLQATADLVLGEHDFTSFCKTDRDVEHYRCTVERSTWTAEDSTLVYEIRANRFLYGMVRALVGTMVEIARGYRPFEDFAHILQAKDRARAGMAAPAKGLFLEQVIY